MLAGMVLLVVGVRFFDGVGLFSAEALLCLGAMGGSFGNWRREPGLWMLSVLFFALFLLLGTVICSASVWDILRGRSSPTSPSHIDIVVATGVGVVQVLFLWTVTRENRKLLRPR
jgi:hypothetical protein